MKKTVLTFLFGLMLLPLAMGQGYDIGDKAMNFKLKNVDGSHVSLSDYENEKGVIVIFTCNHCPYAQAWENRIIKLDKQFDPEGYPVVAIQPNDPKLQPEDSFENMKKRAKAKGYTFPYLMDETQEVYRTYGATKTPHVYLLENEPNGFIVRYIGAIDDNYKDADQVEEKFLASAVKALLNGNKPSPEKTKAIGCSIKD
ncbi:MAG TPA: thioredoxin family protein [Bacteroidales bacterium]|nr:thioredoxin family protein [Bacteroidales bacterium]